MNSTSNKRKVLFLITKSNWGGAQRYVFDLATNLPRERWEPVVALGGDGVLKTKLEAAGVRVCQIPSLTRNVSLKKELLASRAIAHLIRREQPQVLHVNSSKAGAIGAGLGRLLDVPRVIFTAHAWAFNEDRSWVSRTIIKTIHWLTVLFAHHTITASDGLQREMNWPLVQRKMTTIYHGRTTIHFLDRVTAREQLATYAPALSTYLNDVWTVSIGELHPIKQHAVAIAAVRTLVTDVPTLRHLIIGAGELRDTLAEQIRSHQLEQHVFLLGHIDEAAQYLRAADVFVFPSRSESLGYVALEAAQAGVPTVASNVGGIPEVVRDGETGTLVTSGSVTELSDAIARYVHDGRLRTDHGAAAQAFAQQFTITRMLAATETVYKTTT